jgi:outer membrane lipoprotein-sorting protein
MLLAISANAANHRQAQGLLERMESAYRGVKDYQVLIHVVAPTEKTGKGPEEFLYTFKKPRQVRIDIQTPQFGTIVIFPDGKGKVWVRPWGLRLLDLHLAPDSLFIANASGQRIDQTDLGLLIQNIRRSMHEGRRGALEIIEEPPNFRIRVLAEDHFREGKLTRYEFTIDGTTYFPAEIEERSADGTLERKITFRNLSINRGVPDHFFRLNDD